MGLENGLELGISLHGDNARSLSQERERECANSRTDLEHALAAIQLGEGHDALDYVIVDKEVLPQAMLGRQAKLLQQAPRGGRACERGCGHWTVQS